MTDNRMGRRLLWGLSAALLAGSITVSAQESESADLQEGQRMARIRVVSIVGNELTYYEYETEEGETDAVTESETEIETESQTELKTESEPESETDTELEAELRSAGETAAETEPGRETEPESEEESEAETGQGSFPEGDFPGSGDAGNFPMEDRGDIPGGGMGNFSMEDIENFRGKDTGDFPGGGFSPEDFFSEQSEADARDGEDASSSQNSRELPGGLETETVYLPVAVTVHTDRNEDRTFSILEAGDELDVLLQENDEGGETIIEIWMADSEGEES